MRDGSGYVGTRYFDTALNVKIGYHRCGQALQFRSWKKAGRCKRAITNEIGIYVTHCPKCGDKLTYHEPCITDLSRVAGT